MSRWMATISFLVILIAVNFYYLSRDSAQAALPLAAEDIVLGPTLSGSAFPVLLSQLNLFADLPNLQAARGFEPYEVKYPLWSDGTIKLRHIHMPAGTQLETGDAGWFHFPDGTMLSKTFIGQLPNGQTQKLETRVLGKHEGRWTFGTYIWNDSGSDAALTDGDDQTLAVTLAGCETPYVVPGRNACLQCHAGVQDRVIGFAGFQLNESQHWRLVSSGHLKPDAAQDFPVIPGRDELEHQALGYMAGNCAHCHNPMSTAFVGHELDLRPGIAASSLVGVKPGRLTRQDANLLVAEGSPDRSLLYRLFERSFSDHHDTAKFMPPVGNAVVDPAGKKLLHDWIKSLGSEVTLEAR